MDADKQERLKEALKEERRAKEEEAKKKEELAALKRASTFQFGQPRAKLSRANAPCRSCHQLGHWASDPGNYKNFLLLLFSILFLFLKLRSEFFLECPMRGQNMVTKPAPSASQTTAGAPEANQDHK